MRALLGCVGALLVAIAIAMPCAAQTTTAEDAAHQQFVFAYRLMERQDDKAAAQAFDEFLTKYPKDVKRGDALYYRALIAHRQSNHEQAARLLADVPALTLVQPTALALLRGQVHIELNQFDHALAALEPVKTDGLQAPVAAEILYRRGLAYRGARNLAAAKQQFVAAGELETPLQAHALLELAAVQQESNQPAEAIATLDRAVQLKHPQLTPEAAFRAAELSFKNGDFIKAGDFFRVVLNGYQSSPRFTAAVRGLLWSQLEARQFDQLEASFGQYSRALPDGDRAVAFYLAGRSKQEQGKHADAIALLGAAAKAATGAGIEDRALYYQAESFLELGKYDEVAQTIATLSRTYPASTWLADAEFLLADAEARQGKAAPAAARLTRVIDLGVDHPYYPKALYQRARLYEGNGQDAAAAGDYEQFLELVAARPEAATPAEADRARLRLIALYEKLREYEKALAVADKLLTQSKLDPLVEAETLYRRMLVLNKLKRFDEALKTVETLATRHPQNQFMAESRFYRGLLLVALNQPEKAREDLQAAAASADLPEQTRSKALWMLSTYLRHEGEDAKSAQALLDLQKLRGKLSYEDEIWLSRYFVAQGEPAKAAEHLKPVLEAGDQAPSAMRAEALYLSGQCLKALNKLDGALNAFEQVVTLGQGFEAEAKLEHARTLVQQGQLRRAIEEFEQLTSARESRIAATSLFEAAQAYLTIAAERRRASDKTGTDSANEQAKLNLTKLVLLYPFPKLSPLPELSHIQLGELALENGAAEQASKEFTALSIQYPEGPYAVYGKAMVALLADKKSEAAHHFDQLRKDQQKLDPRLAERVQKQLQSLDRPS